MGVAGAVVAGFGAITNAMVNMSSSMESKREQRRANDKLFEAISKTQELANEKLHMFQEQQRVWENVFGSIRDNLSNYYKNLDAESLAAKNIQNLEMEYNRASKEVNQELARRGLVGSGADVSANTSLASNLATRRAEARTNAPAQVAQQQLGYLAGVGLPQQNSITAGLTNSYDTLLQANSSLTNLYSQQAASAGQRAANSMAGVGQSIMQGVQYGLFESALNGGATPTSPSAPFTGSSSLPANWTNPSAPAPSLANLNPLTGQVQSQYKPFNYLDSISRG